MTKTRKLIINISLELFLKNTYKEVTIKDIVGKAGVSQGAFFHYFKSKEDVFHEVIETLIRSIAEARYTHQDNCSLHQYYHDYAEWLASSPYLRNEDGNSTSSNYFSLWFDALKLFPDFQAKWLDLQRLELVTWTNIIRMARKNQEIVSPMSDEQIAKIFIYSSDGISLCAIFASRGSEHTREQLLDVWNGFYEALRA